MNKVKLTIMALALFLLPSGLLADEIPVAVLSTNADSTRTLTFTYAEESTATAKDYEDGIYPIDSLHWTSGGGKEQYNHSSL